MTIFPSVFGRKPNLLVALLTTVAIFETGEVVACFSMFAGFLIDVSLGVFVGVNASILCLISYILGTFSAHYLQKNFLSYLVVSTIFITVFYNLQFLFFYVLRGYDEIFYAYSIHYLPPMIVTWFVSLLFYLVNKILTLPFQRKYLNFT
jgi:rod shape-determining protein MreD